MKIIKILLYIVAVIAFLLLGAYFFLNEKLPVGENPAKADALAKKMQTTLNKAAWDSTNVISWNFKGGHAFLWDKKNEMVLVTWGENKVLLNLKEWNKGKAYKKDKEITDAQLDVLRGQAWKFFCNDSFWLIAPFKIFDEGTTRKIVKTDNSEALLVSYASGGVTPGDSYLWFLDESGVPQKYKMWVKIIPIGGVEATWEKWTKTKTGVSVATQHKLGPLTIVINDLKTGYSLSDIDAEANLFDAIK
jgi:hypothetical protein